MTIKEYEKLRAFANSLKDITTNSIDYVIIDDMEKNYKRCIRRFVGKDAADDSNIYRLGNMDDKFYILAVINGIEDVNYFRCIDGIISNPGASDMCRDVTIYITGSCIHYNVFNVFRFIMNTYDNYTDYDLLSVAYCVFNAFGSLYTYDDLDNAAKYITKELISSIRYNDSAIHKHYHAIRCTLEDMLDRSSNEYIPDILSITDALESAAEYTGDDIWIDPNREDRIRKY